jgi:hypothetical protein
MSLTSSLRAPGAAAPARPARSLRVAARFGGQGQILGGGGGPEGGSKRPAKLIVPGYGGGTAPRRDGAPPKLIVPTQSGDAPAGGGGQLVGMDDEAGAVATEKNFRPPPGFMGGAAAARPAAEEPAGTPQQMLQRLTARSGAWHKLGRLLAPLQALGYDAAVVEQEAGLERRQQNIWATSAQIYESLELQGGVEMAGFARAGGEDLLYELRYLAIEQRAEAAQYIAAQALDAPACLVLARAIKEHERREGEREGFAATAADCLTYKHYRDAAECRLRTDAELCLRKGLAVAGASAGAKAALKAAFDGGVAKEAAPARPVAALTVIRLEREEVGCRPVALVGDWGAAAAADVRAAPRVSSEGQFLAFTVPAEGAGAQRWVPLPAWPALTRARRPVAMMMRDCSAVPEMVSSLGARTDAEIAKMRGEGVLVVDADAPPADLAELAADQYYAVATPEGGVAFASGGLVGGAEVLGPVLMVVRPPSRDSVSAATAELLSL